MAQESKLNLIGVHEHFLPPDYLAYLTDMGRTHLASAELWSMPPQDWIAVMDEYGIATEMVNLGPWGVYSTNLARRNNEYFARLITDYPGRFGAFGFLNFPDLNGALKELEYSMDTLKLDGVCLLTNIGGHYVADPEYEPLLAEMNRRKVVVTFHPAHPPFGSVLNLGSGTKETYGRPGKVEYSVAGIEYPLETTRLFAMFINSGAWKRYPNIRWILPHGGGTMPYLTGRYSGSTGGGKESGDIVAWLKSLYYDTCDVEFPWAMRSLLALVEPTHLLFGTDFGVQRADRLPGHIKRLRENCGFDAKALALVARENALGLFPRLKKNR